MRSIEVLKKHRRLTQSAAGGLSPDQLVTVPSGFKNNILWNLGHILVTQELLAYKLSGIEPNVDKELVRQCARGTSPSDWQEPPSLEAIHEGLKNSPDQLLADYEAGRFSGYRSYTTSTGIELRDVEEAIEFNNFHEGIHLGVILALRKLI